MIYTKDTTSGLYPIAAVGIGPGDSDLITVKGLRALEQADVVFYPSTGKGSFSKTIIDCYNLKGVLTPMQISMGNGKRTEEYDSAFRMILDEYKAGKKVAVVSEGDILFYSTFGYILEHIKENNIPHILIPGIPAFVLGASVMDSPLTEGDDTIEVIARPESFDQITQVCHSNNTVVVMKMNVLKGWPEYLQQKGFSFFYAEKLGTESQFTTTSIETLSSREIPYFSIIIIKPGL
jgi:precorrin-2/cobalt-factor-2 C20-methyltransferase